MVDSITQKAGIIAVAAFGAVLVSSAGFSIALSPRAS